MKGNIEEKTVISSVLDRSGVLEDLQRKECKIRELFLFFLNSRTPLSKLLVMSTAV